MTQSGSKFQKGEKKIHISDHSAKRSPLNKVKDVNQDIYISREAWASEPRGPKTPRHTC